MLFRRIYKGVLTVAASSGKPPVASSAGEAGSDEDISCCSSDFGTVYDERVRTRSAEDERVGLGMGSAATEMESVRLRRRITRRSRESSYSSSDELELLRSKTRGLVGLADEEPVLLDEEGDEGRDDDDAGDGVALDLEPRTLLMTVEHTSLDLEMSFETAEGWVRFGRFVSVRPWGARSAGREVDRVSGLWAGGRASLYTAPDRSLRVGEASWDALGIGRISAQ
jgi:hypothetical protein